MLPNPRKRVLLDVTDTASVPLTKRLRPAYSTGLPPPESHECARLITRSASHGRRALIIQLDKPFYIGRSENCDYQLPEPFISNSHCRIYALVVDTGEVLVYLEDTSTNGTLHNDRKLSRSTVVLCEGDRIEIGRQVFRYAQESTVQPADQLVKSTIKPPTQLGNYLILDRSLGSGAFSTVLLAFNTKTLKQVACKKMERSPVAGHSLASIQREIGILKSASHPNINKIEDVIISDNAVHIFLQLVSGGDLFSYLVKRGRLGAPQAKWILYQLLQGLKYLHETVNVAHRDVKLENIILCSSGSFPMIQLADFGQARYATRDFKSLKGTLQYMAPEQLTAWTRTSGYSGKLADMWSTGIVLALLLIGSHPFEPFRSATAPSSTVSSSSSFALSSPPGGAGGERAGGLSLFGPTGQGELLSNPSERRVCMAIAKGELTLPALKFGSEDFAVRTLLSLLLSYDPRRRATTKQALESRWMLTSKKELEELYRKVIVVKG
ncbi:hypothetical protein JCM1841_003573 [Sporobolomyces salmonicolor]